MNEFQKEINNYALILYWVLVFGISGILLYLVLPGEPKFKYEYQKGFAWQHDDLVAPFDFAILKSETEIANEKAEIIKNIIPYFLFDTTIAGKNLKKLSDDLDLTEHEGHAKLIVFNTLKKNLLEIYNTGILQRSTDSYEELKGKTEIKKRTGTVVTSVPVSQLYSEKSAYNRINDVLNQQIKANRDLKNWIESVSPEKYISANLEFDKTTTDKEIAESTANLSPTRGMVQAGERIILNNELIDQQKFQVLESLKASYIKESMGMKTYMSSLGKVFFILAMLGLVFTFIYIYRHDILTQHRKLAFLLMFMVSMVSVSYFINSFPNLHIYLVPLAIFPIIVRTFFDSRTAIFMLFVITLIIGFYAPNNYEYILLQFSAGVVAVFSLNKMHRRVHLVKAMFLVMFTYWFVYSALNLIFEGSILDFNYSIIKWFAMSSFFILLVYPLVYIFEKLFGFVSDVTLIELSDSNQPLLRKLSEEAPGTFQHSLQIANLAEEVILKIGGNPFLVRAGALYHDIGKISRPNFFIENQSVGMNPHDDLSYVKSAELVIDHVKSGISMAQKYKLPDPIIEFIATHHGTTKANYFFLKHRKDNPNNLVNEDSFMYPGPLPKSKEATVVMLIDGIEAASRSLKEKTYYTIKDLIHKMIDEKIKMNQLDNSLLTFSDINIIKETLLNKLVNIYHVRIEYPKEDID